MDDREKILNVMKLKGPILPFQIAKEVNTNILFASAMLSELSQSKAIRISHLKVGGSPLYFLPAHEERLQEFSNRLNEKDKRAYELLKQNKVLRESELEPIERVSLREIKDFAIALKVKITETEEIFWKWYLVSNGEAESLIRNILNKYQPKEQQQKKAVEKELKEEPGQELRRELKQQPTQEPRQESKQQPKSESRQKQESREIESKIEQPKQQKISEIKEDDFGKKLNSFFLENKIEVVEGTIIKKNSEHDYMLKIPSAVGVITYYCKAKNKKRCNDGDLSSAYVKGQNRKVPVLFISTGELTKQAKEMLESEFKGMNYKKI